MWSPVFRLPHRIGCFSSFVGPTTRQFISPPSPAFWHAVHLAFFDFDASCRMVDFLWTEGRRQCFTVRSLILRTFSQTGLAPASPVSGKQWVFSLCRLLQLRFLRLPLLMPPIEIASIGSFLFCPSCPSLSQGGDTVLEETLPGLDRSSPFL